MSAIFLSGSMLELLLYSGELQQKALPYAADLLAGKREKFYSGMVL